MSDTNTNELETPPSDPIGSAIFGTVATLVLLLFFGVIFMGWNHFDTIAPLYHALGGETPENRIAGAFVGIDLLMRLLLIVFPFVLTGVSIAAARQKHIPASLATGAAAVATFAATYKYLFT